jgi:sporadic carbohydrate cluster 2OG-Fe(II) oxygenase
MYSNLYQRHNEFKKNGFVKIKLQKGSKKKLDHLKKKIYNKFKNKFRNNNFENFHNNVSEKEINKIRIDIIKYINSIKNLHKEIYLLLNHFIDSLLGPDIVVQKSINLGIQMPRDESRALFHKDTPLSSNHEIVVWLPLVNCEKSMCMLLIERKNHNKADRLLDGNDPKRFDKFVKKYGILKEIKFGECLVFNTNNYHYIPINKTNKTRWAINIRFKNLYTPYGERNLLDYYQILKTSPLSEIFTE